MAKRLWNISEEITEEELIEEIKKAEKGPFFSVEESKSRFEKWLQNRLTKPMFPSIIPILQEARENFNLGNSNFVIDFFANNVCQLQIIDMQMAEQFGLLDYRTGEFGFVVYLCFDESSPEDAAKLEKFKSMPMEATFGYNTYQGIPCYGRNLGTDVDEVAKILAFLLIHVYGISPDQTVEASIQY